MIAVRFARTRVTGRAGVYRGVSYTRRVLVLPVDESVRTVPIGAGVVYVDGLRAAQMPIMPTAGDVTINGGPISTTQGGAQVASPAAGEILINGFPPFLIKPGLLQTLFRIARQRRLFVAGYAMKYPLPDYNVTQVGMLRILPGRIVQAPEGEVLVEGLRPSLNVNDVLFAGADAGVVLVESSAPSMFWNYDVAAGAGEVLIIGPEPFTTDLVRSANTGNGEVLVVGYNPGLERIIGWSAVGATSTTWDAQTTVVGSWSDIVVTSTVWTRQTN